MHASETRLTLPRRDGRRFSAMRHAAAAGLLCALASAALAQTVRTVQAAPLRSERSADAATLAALPADAAVNLLQLSGGWAQVQVAPVLPVSGVTPPGGKPPAAALRGWLRASLLDLRAPEVALVSQLETGRRAQGATAVTLGSRGMAPRSNRHALLIGIGTYLPDAARRVEPLEGVAQDLANALAMAATLQVPSANITLLRDEAATFEAVAEALRELAARALPGDRVFIYWSGHGSRHVDAVDGGCVETWLPYDLKDIGNRQLANWLEPIGAKADKLLVVSDAGRAPGGTALLRPKYTPGSDACQATGGGLTRSLSGALAALGLSLQDVVHWASSGPDEASLQAAGSGGLATTALRACLQGEAVDTDGSGSISMRELADCAQAKVDAALRGTAQDGGLSNAPHITVSGNREFVPAWFANAQAMAPAAPVAPVGVAAPPSTPPTATPTDPAGLSLRRVLDQIHEQRDSKRSVVVRATRERLRIGADALGFSVMSSHAGQVYVALLGSDGQTLTLLFPNALDSANAIAAGQTLTLPRPNWTLTAGGPPGTDTLLVLVADGPRDLTALRGGRAGPFVQPLTDAQGRARLAWLLGTNLRQGAGCAGVGVGVACSDAFGSALLSVEEY